MVNDLRRRIVKVERAVRLAAPDITRIVAYNRLSGTVDDATSNPSHLKYLRRPAETIDAFRDRASREAQAHGDSSIIFSQTPASEHHEPVDDPIYCDFEA